MRPAPPTSQTATAATRISQWLDLMRTTDRLLLAGLRRRIGPGGDLDAAYRQWYEQHMREHDAVVQRIAQKLTGCSQEADDAG